MYSFTFFRYNITHMSLAEHVTANTINFDVLIKREARVSCVCGKAKKICAKIKVKNGFEKDACTAVLSHVSSRISIIVCIHPNSS